MLGSATVSLFNWNSCICYMCSLYLIMLAKPICPPLTLPHQQAGLASIDMHSSWLEFAEPCLEPANLVRSGLYVWYSGHMSQLFLP